MWFLLWILLIEFSLIVGAVAPTGTHILIVSLSLRGHVVPLARLAEELTSRGHRVSFAVQEDGRSFCHKTGATVIPIRRAALTTQERRTEIRKVCRESSLYRGILSLVSHVYVPESQSLYDSLSEIVIKDRPHVMVIDIGAFSVMDLAELHGIPCVINNPSLRFSFDQPYYVPAWGSGISRRMDLLDSLISSVYPRVLSVGLTQTFMDLNRMRKERGLPLYRTPQDIFRNVFTIVNTHVGLEYPQAFEPFTKMTGPFLPITHDPPSYRLEGWLNSNAKPVVLVLTGSGSMSYYEDWQLRILAQGLYDSHFRVLWALRKRDREFLDMFQPTQLRVKKNFAQWPFLSHPRVAMVVSPCGAGSTQEALVGGKPLICLPIMGDQLDVASRVQDHGCGISIGKERMNSLFLAKVITTLYRNASFRKCAARMSKILRSGGGVVSAADFIEYSMTPAARYLRESHDLPLHKQLNLDILAFGMVLLSITVLVLRSCVELTKLWWERCRIQKKLNE